MYDVEHKVKENPIARVMEEKTADIPSDVFLWAALGMVGVAFALKLMNRSHQSLFVGQWVAPFLLFGLYSKMVKERGNDWADKEMD